MLRIVVIASFGKRYLAASLVYFGLGLILLGVPFEFETATFAQSDCDEGACAPGYFCCDGMCVPNTYVCCGDGTSGDSANCVCCAYAEPESCPTPGATTTIQCLP